MLKTLVFDTCLNKTYVTYAQDNKVLCSKVIPNKEAKYHSAFLISSIVEILKEFKITIQDIDTFGVNIGPGSFTGIRACITVARVFAQQTQKPLVGVSSLEILSKINKSDMNTLVLMDARRQQSYCALYDNKGNEIIAPELIDIESLDSLPLNDSVIICDEVMRKILAEKGIEGIEFSRADEDFGMYLSELVNEKIKSEKEYFWANIKPLYLQTPPISACAKIKQ